MFNLSNNNNNNQMTNSLSALLAGRIFNPEAYCQLCNKEFCNKYFLKTHKANKHGIQDHSNHLTQSSLNDLATLNKCISPTANTAQLLDEYTDALNSSTVQLSDRLSGKPYCKLCDKEFCNKYFLKTHIQKVHNENEFTTTSLSRKSPPITLSPKQQVTDNQQLQYNELMNAITSSSEQQTSENIVITNNNTNNGQKEMKNQQQLLLQQMFLNNSDHLQQLSAVMQAEQFANILRNSYVQSNQNSSSTTTNELSTSDLAQLLHSTNSTNFLFTPERLREMGVINPEAFCDICCKEFCNKYFLKTHKTNKHGIQMEEDECNSSDSQSNNNNSNIDQDKLATNSKEMCNLDDETLEPGQRKFSINPVDLTTLLVINNLKQQQQQNNLINNNSQLYQQLNNNKDQISSTLNKESAAAATSDFKTTTSSSTLTAKLLNCDLCSTSFQTNQHLKLHRFQVHNIPFTLDESELGADKIEQQTISQLQNTDRNNNSNNEEILNAQKESNNSSNNNNNNELVGSLDLSQQTILDQQNEELLKIQQVIKEMQQRSDWSEFDSELFKKVALIQKQHQLTLKLNEENPIYCDCCEKEFNNRQAFRSHNCLINDNRLADSPSSMFSNLSAQMATTMLNNSNNSTLNYALNGGDTESLVNQTGSANNNLNLSSNGRDSLNGTNNLLLNNLNSSNNCSNQQQNTNRLSPNKKTSSLIANLTQSLPHNLPSDVTNKILFSSTAGVTFDPNNKQAKLVFGRNYCILCNKELCNKVSSI